MHCLISNTFFTQSLVSVKMAPDLSLILPRVLIVSRRTVRKNKFVDFVGEYHLDLIVSNGAAPVIVPRVKGIDALLESFEPIHGVLLCEGEDIDPSLYADTELSQQELDEVRQLHAGDAAVDREKDSIELRLVKLCLERNIPYLGICRGSQILNVACGGTLYQDIDTELSKKKAATVAHMNYDDYDGHRHAVRVVENTPLHDWFRDSLELGGGLMEISVNSYHHQGVKRLARRFEPMAFAPDGLIEGFYDPDVYDPEQGKFIVGLQFHPERMQNQESHHFDYPGCQAAYREFVRAVKGYERRVSGWGNGGKRKSIAGGGLSIARNSMCSGWELQFLEEENSSEARGIIGKMSTEQLSEMVVFCHKMAQMCSDLLEMKKHCITYDD